MTTQVYQNSRAFDSKEYMVHEADFAQLDKPRPLGLTGHLRARDEAMSLRACLDSCLPFLDELIVTYQDSTDETEEILLEYAAKYPEKIRLFWYPLEYATRYGKDAVVPLGHMVNFSNYGYLKTSYHYYMKIDADQIYFTEKMCQIREVLCSLPKQKNTGCTLPKWWLAFLKSYQKKKDIILTKFSHTKRKETFIDIIKYGLQLKQPVSFKISGVNIFFSNNQFMALNSVDPFNGYAGDTTILAPSPVGRYVMRGTLYESFRTSCPTLRISLGFTWIHTGPIKRKDIDDGSTLCPLEDIAQQPWKRVRSHIQSNCIWNKVGLHKLKSQIALGEKFWEKDMYTYFTPVFYNTYFPKMLAYVQKNYKNTIAHGDILRGITKK